MLSHTTNFSTYTTHQREEEKSEEGEEQARSNRRIEGGEWAGDSCISNLELDRVLENMEGVRAHLKTAEFYNWRTGITTTEQFKGRIDKITSAHGTCAVTLHTRHHWLLAMVRKEGTHYNARIYDSAPSEPVRQDIKKFAKRLDWELEFMGSPQQGRNTNECGIFVVWFIYRLKKNLSVASPPHPHTMALGEAREALRTLDWKKIDQLWGRDEPVKGGTWTGELSPQTIGDCLHNRNIPFEMEPSDWEAAIPRLRNSGNKVIPLRIENDWVGTYLDKQRNTLFILASKPLMENARAHIRMIATCLKKANIVTKEVKLPHRQGEEHGGIHLLINCVLAHFHIFAEGEVADYTGPSGLPAGH